MPPEFDEAWEYYTPDPEVSELLDDIQAEKLRMGLNEFATILNMRDDGSRREPTFGVHFGRGNPNSQVAWVPGERDQPIPKRKGQRGRPPGLLITKRCPTCHVEFFVRPSRDRTFCSRACIRLPPDIQKRPEIRAKISARAKARHATNPEWSRQSQARAVAAAVEQQRRGVTQAQREARRRNIKIARAARCQRLRKVCPTCGREFFVIPSRDRTFCHRYCIRHTSPQLALPEEVRDDSPALSDSGA